MDFLTIALIILVVAAAVAKVLHYLLKAAVFPKVLYTNTDGTAIGKCLECRAQIKFVESESQKGLYIFKCDKCGAESKIEGPNIETGSDS